MAFLSSKFYLTVKKRDIIVYSQGWLSLGLNEHICKALIIQDHRLHSNKDSY